eukprot:g24847.t1
MLLVLGQEQSAVPIPITDYALAGISCAAVQSRLIGGPGPDAPEEPKVRLARVGYVTQNTQRRSAWHADGPNPLLRPDSSSRSESKGLDVTDRYLERVEKMRGLERAGRNITIYDVKKYGTAPRLRLGDAEGPWEDECLDAQCAVKMLQLHAAASEQELEVLNGTSCRNFILTGKVQMVHYRNWAVGRAKAHNVRGWVANGGDKSYDGSHSPCPTCGCVLGHVEGSADAVGAFVREMCRGGPPHSHVASCKVEEASCFGSERRHPLARCLSRPRPSSAAPSKAVFDAAALREAAQRRLQRLAERIDAHGASPSGGASPTEVRKELVDALLHLRAVSLELVEAFERWRISGSRGGSGPSGREVCWKGTGQRFHGPGFA